MLPIKKALVCAATALAGVGIVAGSASAAVTPYGTQVTMTSANFNMSTYGFMNTTCSSGLGFVTAPAGSASPNGPFPLTGDVPPATPRLSSCNLGAMTTGSGWTIEFAPTSATQNTMTIRIPGGGAAAGGWTQTGTICGTTTYGPATITASYTDGASSVTINPTPIPFTSTFCGGGNALISLTFSVSPALTIS